MARHPDDDAGLDGRVAIVTGGGAAGTGIGNGQAAALLLARAGARVLVVDRNADFAQRTARMIGEEGGVAAAFEADVTQASQCRAMVEAAVAKFGRLDFVDNNVGVASQGTVVDIEVEEWRRVMQINLESMFLVSKHAIPAMIASAGGGAIVNVSSIAALKPSGRVAYTTSKGAVIALTRSMAVDHGKDGIRVNCIIPGSIVTPMPMAARSAGKPHWRKQGPVLAAEGSGWDTAYAVRFLLSAHARFITGQSLVVDGGTTL